jgi:hypothetical protein
LEKTGREKKREREEREEEIEGDRKRERERERERMDICLKHTLYHQSGARVANQSGARACTSAVN